MELGCLQRHGWAKDADPAHKNFVAADNNGDGSLSFEEFQEHRRKPIGRLDTNDDGLVRWRNFWTAGRSHRAGVASTPATTDHHPAVLKPLAGVPSRLSRPKADLLKWT